MSKLDFTKEQLYELMYEGGVYKDDESDDLTYETVEDTVGYIDLEKGYKETRYVIKELSTGKCYESNIRKSAMHGILENNPEINWKEVFPKEKLITVYE